MKHKNEARNIRKNIEICLNSLVQNQTTNLDEKWIKVLVLVWFSSQYQKNHQ